MFKYNNFSSYFKNALQELDLLAEFIFKPEVCLIPSQW